MSDLRAKKPRDSVVYQTLLESTKAVPWKIDWKSMTFAYIGPQIEGLLGWTPNTWSVCRIGQKECTRKIGNG